MITDYNYTVFFSEDGDRGGVISETIQRGIREEALIRIALWLARGIKSEVMGATA